MTLQLFLTVILKKLNFKMIIMRDNYDFSKAKKNPYINDYSILLKFVREVCDRKGCKPILTVGDILKESVENAVK